MVELDHIILPVNDLEASVAFYTDIVGLGHEGDRPPFSVIRVNPGLVMQLAPWGTGGGQHLAFAMSGAELAAALGRIRAAGLPYGDAFGSVGNQRGPGEEPGARGPGEAVYLFDPNQHLIELRHNHSAP
jgi:catechol 2,3-dioxygenase-like lactoylglutathione lyase family enzyme